VRLLMGEKVAAFDGRGRVERVILSSGSELVADAVVLGVGIEPMSGFVVGVKKNGRGKIVVDERMQAGATCTRLEKWLLSPTGASWSPLSTGGWLSGTGSWRPIICSA